MKDKTTTRRGVLVIGMHRSGTSALARVLSLRGAALPEHVLPANTGNASGYWEPERVVDLNDRMLAHFGLSWDDPFVACQLPPVDAFPASFLAEAKSILEQEYADADLFVLKDPRCTLLHGFWKAALGAVGASSSFIVVMRPYQEVVQSLGKRDGMSAEGAALVYVAYGLEAARAAAMGATVITYEQLLADWRATTDRIAAEQTFSWPISEAEIGKQVDAFLQPRASSSQRVLHLPPKLLEWATQVWSWFDAAAHGNPRPAEELDGIHHDLKAEMVVFGPLLADKSRKAHALADQIDESQSTLARTAAERDAGLAERDLVLQQHEQTETQLQQTQAAFQAMQLDAEDELQRTQAAFQAMQLDAEDELQRTQASYRQLEQDSAEALQAAREELAGAEARISALGQQRDAYRQELELTLSSHSWRITAPLRTIAQVGRKLLARLDDPSGLPTPARPAAVDSGQAVVTKKPPVAMIHAEALVGDQRPHAGLRAFLTAEFDGAVADDVIQRIDRFHLPIPGDETRGASSIDCSVDDATTWASQIARRASHRLGRDVEPDVSIVIPVYNQIAFTLACIDALIGHQSRYRFEILIGDDASTDATAQVLSAPINGVRHVRHDGNLGFVRNCNATAQLARGQYVVLLNNDTQVLPGWLDELVGVLEASPSIGLAGSKLIYPNGKLQECGGIVWRDGSAWNFGRMENPRQPEFCYLRDTDYVSGASIALSRELWEQLGGFDELFVPAYAEDVDLAFRIRARGLRTVVQPLSQVLHFEGISSGTDLGQGAKAYQVANLKKLHARWHDVLEHHRDNADHPELEKERAVSRRMLFVDLVTPTPNEDAGSLIACEMMTAFADSGFKLTFIPADNFAHMGASTRALQRSGVEAIYHPGYASMRTFVSERPDVFDVIVLVRFGVGELHLQQLRERYPAARIIFSNCDLHYLREMREAELSGDQAALAGALNTKERETAVIAAADMNLVHSEAELELLRNDVPGAPCVLFPLVHDPIEHCPPLEDRDGICFVGGYRHAPNADGIIWFVETIWPLVRQVRPEDKLYIAGSSMTDEVKALAQHPNVEIVGFVEDLEAFLACRRVNIAPLRFGAGAKGKVAVSLANGVPVVSTSVGAEGMQLSPGTNILIADSAHDFAASVVDLLANDQVWQQLSVAGLSYAAEVTSRASARARVQLILQDLGVGDG